MSNICIIRTIWDPFGTCCVRFANLYSHSAGKIVDHREYSGSSDFTKKSVLINYLS